MLPNEACMLAHAEVLLHIGLSYPKLQIPSCTPPAYVNLTAGTDAGLCLELAFRSNPRQKELTNLLNIELEEESIATVGFVSRNCSQFRARAILGSV